MIRYSDVKMSSSFFTLKLPESYLYTTQDLKKSETWSLNLIKTLILILVVEITLSYLRVIIINQFCIIF